MARAAGVSGGPEVVVLKGAVVTGPPGRGLTGLDLEDLAIDWSRLIDLAGAHGVLALVARSLKARGWAGVPPAVIRRLTEHRAALTARNLLLTRRLVELVDLLAEAGIDALPYKGPLLAARAYGDIGMRPFGDLDLIVAESDVLPARDLLVRHGYTSLSPRTDAEHRGTLPPGYALALGSPDGGPAVELHWRLAPSFPLRMEELLPHTSPFPLLGSTTVPCLAAAQFVLALCVHGGKHAWERLEWVCGVAHLVAATPELDWDRLADEARSLGARRAVALGLALAVTVADAPVPQDAMRATGATRVLSLAADMERRIVRAPVPGAGGAVIRYALRLRAAGLRDRLRYVLFLRRPTEKDRAYVALPRRLSFLYLVVRPLRVVRENRPRAPQRRQGPDNSQARRALVRQLDHQAQKAAALRGRENEVATALALRWERVRRRLERAGLDIADPRILEVGSGAHGVVFGSSSTSAVGVDPLAVSYAKLFPAWQGRIPTVAAGGERLPFADASFDVVLCDNVVDHCAAPADVLAELGRVLAPGGLLYFTVNVHHRLYSVVARAHRAWNAAGIPLEIGPFADHTVHLTPDEARALVHGLPLDVCHERTYLAEAKERVRRRRLRHLGDLVPRVFFKNALYQVVARRR